MQLRIGSSFCNSDKTTVVFLYHVWMIIMTARRWFSVKKLRKSTTPPSHGAKFPPDPSLNIVEPSWYQPQFISDWSNPNAFINILRYLWHEYVTGLFRLACQQIIGAKTKINRKLLSLQIWHLSGNSTQFNSKNGPSFKLF